MRTEVVPGLNLPNAITLGRVVLALVLGPLILTESFGVRMLAFLVFIVAALSDIYDGYLARSQNLITDFGKLMDPLADKLLLAATFVPFYLLSHGWSDLPFPWFPYGRGVFPLWIVLVVFGRELFITLFRGFAAKRGVVLAAGKSGKLKSVFQNIFNGTVIVWYALQEKARDDGWSGSLWEYWQYFHFGFAVVALVIAVVLTVYSMVVYLRTFSKLDLQRKPR
ncbi:MAG TPA: CDP-alcohol phosphatidyltransferase family protein [Longimicrobiaceae bacterium]|nr:CDP-alcohol phosphatidyltransferase family protein [Longimicrobiaceae bacterium]